MNKCFRQIRTTLTTKLLTLLGFSSPLALMACYGTPVTDYGTEAYIETHELEAHEGDSTSLSIVAEGEWEVVSLPSFITLSATRGDGTTWITVKATEDNTSGEYREGEIVIRDQNGQQSLSIVQQPEVEEPADDLTEKCQH